MKYLAIDYGNKRTGLALCDPQEIVVSPYSVLSTQGNLIKAIVDIITDESIEAVVIGLPLNMDGTEGFQVKRVREFAKQLSAKVDLPLIFQDERLTSFSAKEKLSEMGMTHGKKRKHLDAIAAAEILNAFFETNTSMDNE